MDALNPPVKYEVALYHYIEVEYQDKRYYLQKEFSIDLKYMQSLVKELIAAENKISKITFYIKITIEDLEKNTINQESRRFAENQISPGVLYSLHNRWIEKAKNKALPEIKEHLQNIMPTNTSLESKTRDMF